MKLSKTKKIILLGASIGILITSIVVPIVVLNNNENNDQEKQNKKDVESIIKILEKVNNKIIFLPSDSTGNIIASAKNKNAIIKKLRELIYPSNINGKANHWSLKGTTIEISMDLDAPISTTPQNIIVSITKNNETTLKTIKTFQVKRDFTASEDILAIKKILESKTGNDLIIALPSDSTGNIIAKIENKNAVEKKLRMLIDSSNTSGDPNHASLRGTTIEVSMISDAPISTTPQDIFVSIRKTGGVTFSTSKTFQVKRDFIASDDILAIKKILDSKSREDLIITLPISSTGSIINNPINKNAIERKVRMIIDPSNTSGDPNHASLRGTTITLTKVIPPLASNDLISNLVLKVIVITISKTNGTSLTFEGFSVWKS